MKGYVYISNANKPKWGKDIPHEVKLTNMSLPCLKAAIDLDYDVFIGVGEGVKKVISPFSVTFFESYIYRNPFAVKDNYCAFKALNKVIKEKDVKIIHCNTPVGGLIGRLSGKKCKVKKVVYQAHGFHFYKGAPIKNWLLYYPIEKLLARWTDAIITMNGEDYEAAKRFKLRSCGKVYYVHGVGINTKEFNIECDKEAKRRELGLKQTDIILISMGDLIKRKNYNPVIEAVAKLKNPDVHYLICGKGPELDRLKALAKSLGVEEQIHFLGFRTDVKELLQIADIFVFSTLQEGLPRSLMEAMSAGLPCVVSKIRGNVDLVEEEINGFLCGVKDSDAFADAIQKLANDTDLRDRMREANLKKISEFDISVVSDEIKAIYADVLANEILEGKK